MIDEADEEALFERLRERLRTGSAAPLPKPEPSIGVRTLASGIERLARRIEASEAEQEKRIEQAVAHETAALRMSISRLEERLAALSAPPPRTRPGPAVLIVVLLLAVAAGAVLAVRFGIVAPDSLAALWHSVQNEAARLATGLRLLLGV